MINLVIEILKHVGIMVATSIGINLLLRPKMEVKFSKNEILALPIVVFIEEVIFRLGVLFLLGLVTSDPTTLIIGSTIPFALVHLSNLKAVKHTTWDALKYLLNIGTLGAILAYLYLQYGFLYTFAVHLIYDFIVATIYLTSKKYGGKKHGRQAKSSKRVRRI